MGLYAFTGFAVGFVFGLFANLYLLRGTPKEKYLTDKSLRRRFGLLNWGVAFLGMVIAIALYRSGY